MNVHIPRPFRPQAALGLRVQRAQPCHLRKLSSPSHSAGRRRFARHKNKLRSAAVADSPQTGSSTGLLLAPDAKSWDSTSLGNPVVRCYQGQVDGEEQTWKMWYSGSDRPAGCLDAVAPASGSIGAGACGLCLPPPSLMASIDTDDDTRKCCLAVSSDGIAWQREEGKISRPGDSAPALPPGVALGPNEDNWWWHDTMALSVGDVQVFASTPGEGSAGVYWMYYAGSNFEEAAAPRGLPGLQGQSPAEGLRLRPGLAMSQDGRNWARIEGEHHTGALFDVGKAGEWDETFIAGPQVVVMKPGDMRMFYHSFDIEKQRFVVGMASSKEGFRWKKEGAVFSGSTEPGAFDSRGVTSRHVVRDPDSSRWLMFYEGVGEDGRSSIGLAVSDDGSSGWRRCPQPILQAAADKDAWDAGSVGSPCAVAMAYGKWRLYYSGRSQAGPGQWEGIGLALTADVGDADYEGIMLSFKRRASS